MLSIQLDVQRSIDIRLDPEMVFQKVSDFHTWPQWSPWLTQEPDCPVTIIGNPGETGHEQAWEGSRIGKGQITLVRAQKHQALDYDLEIIKPLKNRSRVSFEFSGSNGNTRVDWSMAGKLPFFLFPMKKMMAAWIGCDYERGLNMLKEYAETGSLASRVEVDGITDPKGFFYMGVRQSATLDNMESSMARAMEGIGNQLDQGLLPKPDMLLTFYHQFDMVKRYCEFTSGCGYFKDPGQGLPPEMVRGQIPGHQALKVIHTGPYRHLGNAWAAAMACQRAEKRRINKAVPMYEIYENDPCEVDEADIRTGIYIPIR